MLAKINVNFDQITIYELSALILSAIAILIPLIQWVWKKFIVKAKVAYYPTGNATLFINMAGSYIQFYGVLEAQRKSIVIRDVKLKIIRKRDDSVFNLKWSVLMSPVNQQIIGNFTSTSEVAHPFKIETDSISTAFIEFTDQFNSASLTLQPYFENLQGAYLNRQWVGVPFQNALNEYRGFKEYQEAKEALSKQLFWQIGEYEAVLEVDYDKKAASFQFNFNVKKDEFEALKYNMEQTLDTYIYSMYGLRTQFKSIQVEVKESK